ncbi:MAG: hypothetical protein QME07_06430 [bacterium]|nr:hypothetical protein [bacterium]
MILFLPSVSLSQLPIYERHIKMPAISGSCELEIGDSDVEGKQDEVPGFYRRIKSTLLGKVEGFDAAGLIEIDRSDIKQLYLSAEKERIKGEAGDIYLDISKLTATGLNLRGLNLERKTKNLFSIFLGRTKEAEEDVFAQYGGGIKAEFYSYETKVGFACLSFLDDESSVNLPNLSPISSNLFSCFGSKELKKIGSSIESELAMSSFTPDKRKKEIKKDMAMTVKLRTIHERKEMELSYNQVGKDYQTAGNPYLLKCKEAYGIKASQPIRKAALMISYEKGKESGLILEKIGAELADIAFLGIRALSGCEIEKKEQKSKSTRIYLELEKEVKGLSLSPAYEWTGYDDEVINDSDYTMNNLALGAVGDIGSVTLSSGVGYSFSSKGPEKAKEANYNLFLSASYALADLLFEPEYSLYLDTKEKKKIQQEETISCYVKYSISPKYQGIFGIESKELKDFSASSNNYKIKTLKTGFQVLF